MAACAALASPNLEFPYSCMMMELTPFPPGLELAFSAEAPGASVSAVPLPPGLELPLSAEAPVFIPGASLSAPLSAEAPVFIPGVSVSAVPLPPGLEHPHSEEVPAFARGAAVDPSSLGLQLPLSAEAFFFTPGVPEYELCASLDQSLPVSMPLTFDQNQVCFHFTSQMPHVMPWSRL